MLCVAPTRWVRELVPASRYRLTALYSDGEALYLHLSTALRGQRFPLVVQVTPQRTTYHQSPALSPPLRAAVLRDLQQRSMAHRDAIQLAVSATRKELARRAADPAWAALDRLAAGHAALGPPVAAQPGRRLPPHRAALGAIQRLLADDADGFEDFYLNLATEPAIDARVMAAIALAAGDSPAAATLRPLPAAQDQAAVWRWLQGAPTVSSDTEATLSLADRAQVAARAVWHWGAPADRPAAPVYGSPLARGQKKPALQHSLLTEQRVAQFMADGFVALRGALPRARAAAWARRVAGHFQDALADDPAHGAGLVHPERLDPDAPDAGFGGELRWRTGCSIPLHLFSVELASLVDALVGLEHLQSNVSDQLLLTRDIHLRPPQPNPSWHLDEAPPEGRLDNQRLAVLALVLLTDVAEPDGPTMFLPDSPPLVARALAQSPNLDQDDRDWTAAIGARCARRLCATGAAGDIFLLHPMTLHARKRPQRISQRILANVNLHAHQPLSYTVPHNPIERYARPD